MTSRRAQPPISHHAPLAWWAPEGLAAVPVGGGGAWQGYSQRPSPTGVEGAGGTCRGAGGRRRGLAGTTQHHSRRRCGGRRRARRARAGFEARRRTK